MINLKVELGDIYSFLPHTRPELMENELIDKLAMLFDRTGKGNDFLGWVDLPAKPNNKLIEDILTEADRIKSIAQIFIVIGIGGSYLGARAVIEALGHSFYDLKRDKGYPYVIFAGQNIGEDYMYDLMQVLDEYDYAVTVISKSGTTTEPAIAFRLIKNHLEAKYGKEGARKRIIAITDKEKGALKKLSVMEGYKTYEVPDDVGGRYSVLTPVGLFPIAVAGFDIRALINGALNMMRFINENRTIDDNPALRYAAARNLLYRSGKTTEILVNYLPGLYFFSEWWKQLFGESEGKEGKGIFPAAVGFTTDLHSMGQYIQEGMRNIFETVISVEKPANELLIPHDGQNLDTLNYLAGKNINYVNLMAEKATRIAHVDGGVPNIRVVVPVLNASILGEMIYFFEIACGISGYVLGVNPFDQPGVEAYKNNMFALLGKPGFEKETQELRKRI